MAKLDNPAGRLHTLLTAFVKQARETNVSILGAWETVFETETEAETLLRVAEAANLLPETQRALERVGDQDQLSLFHTFAGDWLSLVMHPRQDLHTAPARTVLPSKQHLTALGGVSAFLSAVASEGPVPAQSVQDDLRSKVLELIDEITEDPDLTEEIRRQALDHVHRLLQSLDHFRISGPGGVKAATERLMGAVVLAPPAVREQKVWTKVVAVAGAIWTAFTLGGPASQQALESWTEVIKMLPGGG